MYTIYHAICCCSVSAAVFRNLLPTPSTEWYKFAAATAGPLTIATTMFTAFICKPEPFHFHKQQAFSSHSRTQTHVIGVTSTTAVPCRVHVWCVCVQAKWLHKTSTNGNISKVLPCPHWDSRNVHKESLLLTILHVSAVPSIYVYIYI